MRSAMAEGVGTYGAPAVCDEATFMKLSAAAARRTRMEGFMRECYRSQEGSHSASIP
jgi:hypothetical protein